MALLSVTNFVKQFGDHVVLRGVDFTLEKGQVLSIIGSSGGGKTTLLRCINFLEIANAGQMVIGGDVVFSAEEGKDPFILPEAQKKLGLVFQQFNLFPQYTAKENLMLAPRLAARSRADYKANRKEILAQIEAKADNLLSTVGLSEKADFYPCQLSGGQQQRVAIARALMTDPDVLCFDEPTSALDPELTGEVLRVIKELRDAGRTMIIVTHEISFAKSVSDKIIFMADGIIEEMGTPEEVMDNPKSPKTRAFLQNALK